jgi:hypothetical protein
MAAVRTDAEALDAARRECERLDIPWQDPIIKRGWRWWRVSTPGGQRGGNTVVLVSRKDGSTRVRRYAR